ncbi:MAG: acyl-CoA reductase [Eudoraea sp.]|nr:acyl-CoA reductase [Eudoraea sp.]
MLDLAHRIKAFKKLGDFFRDYIHFNPDDSSPHPLAQHFLEFDEVIENAGHKNGWFTKDNIRFAIASWGDLLTEDALQEWIATYSINTIANKKIAVIMAGNIPLVGFHDFLSVLITGHSVIIKPASNDSELLPFIIKILEEFEPGFKTKIETTKGQLKEFDGVIATGSNNTARYFEHYFGSKPHIIRRNRNSVAVLTGEENEAQLTSLGEDIFRYFGLGCRSVSKLFVPQGYDFSSLFEAIESYHSILDHQKYNNNYDYNKAVYLMSEFPFLDNGFFMVKEDENYASPIGTAFYEYYISKAALQKKLLEEQDKIQCIVSESFITGEVRFGDTQKPQLSDYADGIDTVEFLLKT